MRDPSWCSYRPDFRLAATSVGVPSGDENRSGVVPIAAVWPSRVSRRWPCWAQPRRARARRMSRVHEWW